MKIVISAITQDHLNAIRLGMISTYFRESFREGTYRFKRGSDQVTQSLEMAHLAQSQIKTVEKLVPKLWPGVTWDIKTFTSDR